MQRLQTNLAQLLDCLHDIYALRDLATYRVRLLAAVRRLIGADRAALCRINARDGTVTWIGEPGAAWLPAGEDILARHLSEHPVLSHRLRTGDLRALRLSDFLTRRDLRRLGLYTEFLRPLGAEYVLSVALQASPTLVLTFVLTRARRDFSDDERLLLAQLRPHLVQGHRHAELLSQLRGETALVVEAVEASGGGVMLLGPDGCVRVASPRARQWVAKYWGGSGRSPVRLPDPLRAWVRRNPGAERGDGPPCPAPLVTERDGSRLSVRVLTGGEQTVLLFEEEARSQAPGAELGHLGFTRRECEVAAWLSRGKTNREIGSVLGARPRTVAKHIERIFEKLGVETRTAAASRLLTLAGGAV